MDQWIGWLVYCDVFARELCVYVYVCLCVCVLFLAQIHLPKQPPHPCACHASSLCLQGLGWLCCALLHNDMLLVFWWWALGLGLWAVGCDLWLVVCGLSFVVCGLWSVVCGQWLVVCGHWSVVRGRWLVVCGLWFVVCGWWSVVGGLWLVVHKFFGCSGNVQITCSGDILATFWRAFVFQNGTSPEQLMRTPPEQVLGQDARQFLSPH